MNNEVKYEQCPLCGKNCNIKEVKCCRGKKFVRLLNEGEITEEKIIELKEQARKREEFKNLPQEDRLMIMLGKCGMILNNKSCGHHGRGRILKVLLEKGTITQSELQDIIDIRSGSLSEILSKMEDKQLIIREKDENDKRKVRILMTEKGKETILLKEEEHKNKGKELFNVINEDEQNQLEMILSKLIKSWKMNHNHDGHMRGHGKCTHKKYMKEHSIDKKKDSK
ncbi:MarR family winged helix-turn-helix transcriptional regulator [uncultured Clostridium sp.]|uniref:MarR family winged helix-turn-helix transcriptional regulator n=1 Tax=uncultured Clostridium sp. TaxID=59620 RepID=UPI0025F6637C|nr:MarR family transcriptional regulator [uncultured Clostridium sp.]MDU4884841.1 MarR family transcriptional regulator [Clostridium celatum]MDU7078068.1 MarR family transcriptional regulator [Clostridium celatum]